MDPGARERARGRGRPQRIAYYDDACGFCRRLQARLDASDRFGRVRFIAAGDAASHLHAVSAADLARSLIVFDVSSGRRWERAQAVAALASVLPLPWRLLRALSLPVIAPLADWAYDGVARHRGWLSRRLGHVRCDVAASADRPRGRSSENIRG